MSAHEHEYGGRDRTAPSQAVAGFLAAAAIFGGIVALFYYPGRIGPAAVFFALVAAGMGGSIRRFAAAAMAVSTLGLFFGLIVAVFLDRPIF